MSDLSTRRPLTVEHTRWDVRGAAAVAKAGLKPEGLSALAMAFAILGAAMLAWSGPASGVARVLVLILAIICILLRLFLGRIAGIAAVEHGKAGRAGPIWNELPDRISDVFLLVGAGYGAISYGPTIGSTLGWLGAVLAVMTAYMRTLGAGLGFAPDFCGPMAKPHRMAVLTGAAAAAMFEPLWGWHGEAMAIAGLVVVMGCVITLTRRTVHLARRLDERAGPDND